VIITGQATPYSPSCLEEGMFLEVRGSSAR
jgi:hypothetical protein